MKILAISLASLACMGLSGPWQTAAAQDALGTGNALDANLSIHGTANLPTASEDYRARNNIITGNVIGGRGFRGSVGYTAPGDFRGSLGSNDLFSFRADSAISSSELFRFGTTVQQLQFGQDLGAIEYRRSGSGLSGAGAQPRVPLQVSESSEGGLRVDRGALASSIGTRIDELSQPRVVGMTYTSEGVPLLFDASATRGVTIGRADQHLGTIGLTPMDVARLRQDFQSGTLQYRIGQPFQTPLDRLSPLEVRAPDSAVEPPPIPQQVELAMQPDYARILTRISDRYASSQGAPEERPAPDAFGSRYQEVREQLLARHRVGAPDRTQETTGEQRTVADATGRIDPTVRPDRTTPPVPDDASTTSPPTVPTPPISSPPDRSERSSRQPPTPPAGENVSIPPPPDTDLAGFGVVLRHGERIESLVGPTRDRFNELMATAEQALTQGDYINAERRFERALRFTPGHPLASVGVTHAQLGAGLYLSAGLTLRQLMTRQPEMIDATYAPQLLPTPARLDAAVAALKQRIDEAAADRSSYGLLLAYIGRQRQDDALVTQGLNAMSDSRRDRDLLELLRSVWQAPKDAGSAQPGK